MRAADASPRAGAQRGRCGRGLLWASAGMFVWASCLVLLYAVLSIGCRAGSAVAIGEPFLRGSLVAAWALHALLIALLATSVMRSRSERERRARRATATRVIGTRAIETGAIEMGAIERRAIETSTIGSGAIESGVSEAGVIEAGAAMPRTGRDGAFIEGLALLLNGAALFATLWIGFPALWLPPCQ